MLTASTDKSLSWNYISFKNQVDTSGKVNPFLIRLKIFKNEYRWLSWRIAFTVRMTVTFRVLRTALKIVCDVNSKCRRIQVNSVEFIDISIYNSIIQISLFSTELTDTPYNIVTSHIESPLLSSNTNTYTSLHIYLNPKICKALSSTFFMEMKYFYELLFYL